MDRIRNAIVGGTFAEASAAFLDGYQAAKGQETVSLPNRFAQAASDRGRR
jgi:hypothetical protein